MAISESLIGVQFLNGIIKMEITEPEILNVTDKNISLAPNSTEQFIDILVEPARRGRETLHGKFDTWDQDGRAIVTACQTPFCKSARVLLKRGASPEATLRMFRLKSNTHDLSAPITVAASLTVTDCARNTPYFSKWRPFCRQAVKTCSDQRRVRATQHRETKNNSVLGATA